jgi:acyl-CoA synthetase (AMP-forming)/AMP-acid ligase II
MSTAVLATPFVGHFVLIMQEFNLEEYLKHCAQRGATIMRVVPPTAMAMAKNPALRSMDLSSVHTLVCAGAALGDATQARLQEIMKGVSVVQGYG